MSKELFEQIREKEFYDLFGLDYEEGCLLEKLLLNSAIPIELEREIHQRFYNNCLTKEEGENIIEYLKQNQSHFGKVFFCLPSAGSLLKWF